MLAYIQRLAESFTSHRSVSNYLGAINTMHRELDDPFDIFASYRVRVTVRALPFTMRHKPFQRPPIQLRTLSTLVLAAQRGHHPQLLGACLVLLFFSMLRQSNVGPRTRTGFDPSRHLTRDDARFVRGGVALRVRWSKTRQAPDERRWLLVPELPGSHLDPVTLLKEYLQVEPTVDPRQPLFSLPRARPLTSERLAREFDQLVRAARLPEAGYTLHSFRRGGASLAKRFGASLEDIKRHGTWRSNAVWEYLHQQPVHDTVTDAFIKAAQEHLHQP